MKMKVESFMCLMIHRRVHVIHFGKTKYFFIFFIFVITLFNIENIKKYVRLFFISAQASPAYTDDVDTSTYDDYSSEDENEEVILY